VRDERKEVGWFRRLLLAEWGEQGVVLREGVVQLEMELIGI